VTLEDLRVFAAVCEARSLSSVARTINCTQSAVSQHVRRLEAEFGLPLLERGRHGVVPTAAGHTLHAAALEALAALDGADRTLSALRTGEGGVLRIATGGTTLRHFMAEALVEFRRNHSRVAVEFVSATSSTQCVAHVQAGRADIAFITLGSPAAGVAYRPVIRTSWVLAARDDDPLARRRSLRPEDLGRVRLIAMPEHATTRQQFDASLGRHGLRVPTTMTVDDWDTAIQLVELGLGHAVVPAMWLHDIDRHPTVRAIPIPFAAPVTFGWAARRWDTLDLSARRFVDQHCRLCRPLQRTLGVELIDPDEGA
jgi:DNA-binding transcriptional LysR family regulator